MLVRSKNILFSKYPSKGYAWSLYRLLTGEKIPIVLPDIKTGNTKGLNKKETYKAISLLSQEDVVYPNPTNGILNIQVDQKNWIEKIELFDLSGKVLFNKQLNNKGSFYQLNLKEYDRGVYLIQITLTDGELISKKTILNR